MTTSSPEREAWIEGIEATNKEAAGVWDTYVFRPQQDIDLALAAAWGDEVADAAVRAIDLVARGVKAASRRKGPALCICCHRPIRHGELFAVAVVMAESPGRPRRSKGAPVCERCVADEATLTQKVIAAVRKIVPDARVIPDPAWHKPGHA